MKSAPAARPGSSRRSFCTLLTPPLEAASRLGSPRRRPPRSHAARHRRGLRRRRARAFERDASRAAIARPRPAVRAAVALARQLAEGPRQVVATGSARAFRRMLNDKRARPSTRPRALRPAPPAAMLADRRSVRRASPRHGTRRRLPHPVASCARLSARLKHRREQEQAAQRPHGGDATAYGSNSGLLETLRAAETIKGGRGASTFAAGSRSAKGGHALAAGRGGLELRVWPPAGG